MRAIVLLLTLAAALPQNGYDLFQKALVKERAEGKLEEALQLYERVVREFADQKEVVADAGRRLAALSLPPASNKPGPRLVASDDKNSDDYESISLDGRWMAVTKWSGAGNNDNELEIQDMSTGQLKRLQVGSCGKPCTFADSSVLSRLSRFPKKVL